MPIVRVTMLAGRSREQKSALAKDVTHALVHRCGADAACVNILFEDVELDHWIAGSDAIAQSEGSEGQS
jgi:4-oxalocrotonate tautomerase family enzyme